MTTILAPLRTSQQRQAALNRANQIRVDRALMKRAIKGRHLSALEVLEDPPDYALTMKLAALLLAVPKFGTVKARRVMHVCRISDAKTVGGLSDRQRREVVHELDRIGVA